MNTFGFVTAEECKALAREQIAYWGGFNIWWMSLVLLTAWVALVLVLEHFKVLDWLISKGAFRWLERFILACEPAKKNEQNQDDEKKDEPP